MRRLIDSGFTPFDSDLASLDLDTERTVAQLQTELIRMLRVDQATFDAGDVCRALANAEKIHTLRSAIKSLDPNASLYWTFKK